MQEEYEDALEDKKIVKLGNQQELAYEDLILLIITSSTVGKVAFGLVQNAKSLEFPEVNCNLAWDRCVKYVWHNSLYLLKSGFYNIIEKDHDEVI